MTQTNSEVDIIRSDLELEAAYQVASQIRAAAQAEVRRYVESNEFRSLVESLKHREKKRILQEVDDEIEATKGALLLKKKRELVDDETEKISLQNKIRIEEQQRILFEQKLQSDAARLDEIKRRAQLEEEEEQMRAETLDKKEKEKNIILNR